MDEQDISKPVEKSSEETGIAARKVSKQKSLESLLLDDSAGTRSVERIAEQEVRVVSKRKTRSSGSLLVLVLLGVLLLGVGYFYLGNVSAPNPPVRQQSNYLSPKLPVPERPKVEILAAVDIAAEKVSAAKSEQQVPADIPSVEMEVPLFTVTVGPFINTAEVQQAISRLQELGFQPQKSPGHGQVTMVRLLEGIYPAEEARVHLARLKKVVDSAFLLPDGNNLAVYAGSFHQKERARQMQDDLARERVNVTLVDSEITMGGTMLAALQADQQTAREVAAHISSLGLQTQVLEKK